MMETVAKNVGKIRWLEGLDKVNLAYHLGFFTSEEKNGLVSAIKTGILSENLSSMLDKRLKLYPERYEFLEVVDYFRKGEKTC